MSGIEFVIPGIKINRFIGHEILAVDFQNVIALYKLSENNR
jgi:hypothetical protein